MAADDALPAVDIETWLTGVTRDAFRARAPCAESSASSSHDSGSATLPGGA